MRRSLKEATVNASARFFRHIDFRLLGMAMPTFCSDLFMKCLSGQQTEAHLLSYLPYTLMLFGFALLSIIQYRRLGRKSLSINTAWAVSTIGSAVLCLTYLLLFVAVTYDIVALYFVAAIIGGFGLANCYSKWFFLFSTIELKTATITLLTCFALGNFLRLALSYATLQTTLLLAAVLVIVFQMYYLRNLQSFDLGALYAPPRRGHALAYGERPSHAASAARHGANRPGAGRRTGARAPRDSEAALEAQASLGMRESTEFLGFQADYRHIFPFVVVLLLYSFVMALVRVTTAESQYLITPNTLNLFLRTCFPVLLIILIIRNGHRIRFVALYQISLILVAFGVFIVRLFVTTNTVLTVALTSFTRGVFILFLFLTLLQLARHRSFPPLAVLGVGLGTFVGAQGIGLFLYLRTGFELDSEIALNIIFLLVALSQLALLLANFYKGGQSSADKTAPPDLAASGGGGGMFAVGAAATADDDNGGGGMIMGGEAVLGAGAMGASIQQHAAQSLQAGAMAARFSTLQKNYGLTEREVEILALVCQGRTKRHIAEMLVISENTVRGHVRSLYSKCGVHSKQHLINLIDLIEL
jgi:DNA-binding CsgD family transcriptional regulator